MRDGLHQSTSTFTSSTFYNNGDGSSGAWLVDAYPPGATFLSCILWGNGAESFRGTVTFDYSDIQGDAGRIGTNFSEDPLFVSTTPGAVDLRLSAGSPCIDRAPDDANIPQLDALGQERWDDPSVPNTNATATDIGAYERQPE